METNERNTHPDGFNAMKMDENPKFQIKKFHWGACTLCLFWGIGHRVYITLLCLIPILNIIWPIVCGFKGYEWAWEQSKFESMDAFMYSEESWNRIGFILAIIELIFFIIWLILMAITIFAAMSLINDAGSLEPIAGADIGHTTLA